MKIVVSVATLARAWKCSRMSLAQTIGGLDFWFVHRLAKVATFATVATFTLICATQLSAEENRSPSVGAEGRVEQVILPGSELIAKPLDDREDEIVVRVVETFAHGDGFRYDLQFYGMEPGKYDLAEWLVRKDGSSTEGLPEIPIEIRSLLPPGQITPNELSTSWFPSLGGYKMLAIAAAAFWTLVFLALIFWPRRRAAKQVTLAKHVSFADLLHERIETALESNMTPGQHAELERMLFAFWRKRLKLESLPPHQALAKIKKDSDAGPLMVKLEEWMHSPNPDRDIDLKKLLKPYADMPAPEGELSGSGAV